MSNSLLSPFVLLYALIGGSYAGWRGGDQRQGWGLLVPAEQIVKEYGHDCHR